MSDVFLDADVLIWHLRAHPEAVNLLEQLSRDPEVRLYTSAAQRMEIVFFLRPDEYRAMAAIDDLIETLPVTKELVDFAAELYRRWNPSHGTGRNDAILAATVMLARGTLYTQNTRHFPMPGLDVRRGWEPATEG